MVPPPPTSTLFPYTTLFRSAGGGGAGRPQRAPVECDGHCFSSTRYSAGTASAATFSKRRSNKTSASKRSEEHTSELQSRENLVCRLLLEKKKKARRDNTYSH